MAAVRALGRGCPDASFTRMLVHGLRNRSCNKNKGRGRPLHFRFRVRILDIKPWPPAVPSAVASKLSPPSLILRWQRGNRRSGSTTKSVAPAEGKLFFNECFDLPVTLYCSSSSPNIGPGFQEKLIIFTLVHAHNPTGPPLARATLDLAAYASSTADDDQHATIACMSMILSRHVPSGAVLPSLQIIVTSSPHRQACFGEGKCHTAHLASYLPLQSARFLKNPLSSSPALDSSTYEALTAALVDEKDEEIEAFTDDESSDGVGTPLQDEGSKLNHYKDTTSTYGTALANSRAQRASPAQVPCTTKRSSDEISLYQSSSEVSSPSEVDFFTSSRGVSPANNHISSAISPSLPSHVSAGKQTLSKGINAVGDDQKSLGSSDQTITMQTKIPSSTTKAVAFHQNIKAGGDQTESNKIMGAQPTEESGGRSIEVKHMIEVTQPTDSKMQSFYKSENNAMAERNQTSEIKPQSKRILKQLHAEHKVWRLSIEDLDSELLEDYDRISLEEMSVLEEARQKFALGAERRNEKIEKRELEDAKVKLSEAEAKLSAASERESYLQSCIGTLEGELQDVAYIETIVYCTVAEHGGFPQSVLTPAHHLAKLHNYAITNWSNQRRASLIGNTVSGLVLATRACGQDIPRLTFWWSNVLALRHAIMLAYNVLPLPSSLAIAHDNLNPGGSSRVAFNGAKGSGLKDPAKVTSTSESILTEESYDWTEPSIFIETMERVEAWIYSRVVESIWWQVLAPQMQKSECPSLQQDLFLETFHQDDAVNPERNGNASAVFDIEDGMQQNISIDVWKRAFLDALQKLCPVRAEGKECSCIPGLSRLVIEECIARLDVSMFNAILPISDTEAQTDPISDAIYDTRALPIPPGSLTFGAGAQLKNVVGTWSTWLTILLEKLSNTGTNAAVVDEYRQFLSFPLLKAVADLLMLPRDMVADKSVRKEVCPVLTLPVIRRILSSVEPDEFAPDPVSPSLLAALNTEIALEKLMYGDHLESVFSADGMALKPRVTYCPQSTTFKDLIQSVLVCTVSEWSSQSGSVEDVLHELKALLTSTLQVFNEVMPGTSEQLDQVQDVQKQIDHPVLLRRFKLLQELWIMKPVG